jgi:hypothetical protein
LKCCLSLNEMYKWLFLKWQKSEGKEQRYPLLYHEYLITAFVLELIKHTHWCFVLQKRSLLYKIFKIMQWHQTARSLLKLFYIYSRPNCIPSQQLVPNKKSLIQENFESPSGTFMYETTDPLQGTAFGVELSVWCDELKSTWGINYSQCHRGMQSVTCLAQHQSVTSCRTIFQFHRLDCMDKHYYCFRTLKRWHHMLHCAVTEMLNCCGSHQTGAAGSRRSRSSFLDAMQIIRTHTRHSLWSYSTLLNSLEKSPALRTDSRTANQ